MFNNIGGRIKSLAKAICWIGIIGCVVTGIVLMIIDDDYVLIGILIAVFGSAASWIGTFFMYGFGQLIENSDIIAQQCSRNYQENVKESEKEKQKTENKRQQIRKERIIDADTPDDEYFDIQCPNCGAQLSFTKLELLESEKLLCLMCNKEFNTEEFRS